MLIKHKLHFVSFFLLNLWVSSCTTAYYLEHHPGFAEDIFYRKVRSADQKLIKDDDKLFLEAVKLRTQYTYAFLVEIFLL